MVTSSQILSTLHMIDREKLDVRTITMGISLFGCVSDDEDRLCQKVYDHIARTAQNLVRVGEEIEREIGVPIVNKRISVTPAALISGGVTHPVKLAKALDRAAHATGVNFIGGYSALVQKGMTAADRRLMDSIPEALSETEFLCSSINIGSTRAGIDMDAVRLMGQIVKDTAQRTAESGGLGCAKLVVFSNAVEDNPFMAGAFHGPGEGDCAVSVGVSGPGVVKCALEAVRGQPFDEVAETIKLNDAVKKGGVMASSHVGGLSGAFIPVSEDIGMIAAAERGALTLDKLEAMTCVCSVGLDMIAIPGDTTAETISAIIADEAAIGMINNKTVAVRVIPVPGAQVGDSVEFGGLLGHAPVMPVHPFSSADFIHRGGRIPAPLHSLRN